MKKALFCMIVAIAIGTLILFACTPIDPGLSGQGGLGNSNQNDNEQGSGDSGGNGMPSDQSESPLDPNMQLPPPPEQNVEPPVAGSSMEQAAGAVESSANQKLIAEKFYLPALTIIMLEDGSFYGTELSSSSMGIAEYQLTAPKFMDIGKERTIELIVVPENLQIEKTEVFESVDEMLVQAFQGTMEIYPYMTAEVIAGDSFSIKPEKLIDHIILDDGATVWFWYITALQAGDHILMVSVSVPTKVGEIVSQYEVTHIEFAVSVLSSSPTDTPTSVPVSTATAIAKATATATATGASSAQNPVEWMGIIAAIITLIAAIMPFYQNRQKKKKTNAEQKAKADKEVPDKPRIKK